MTAFTFHATDEDATRRFAGALAAAVQPGLVIALVGPLGAGKTTLVRGIVEELGVDPRTVSSPTFVLVHHYQGRIPCFHFDAYRLASPDEFLELGSNEYFAVQGLTLVEWADRVEDCLPADRVEIRIDYLSEQARSFVVQSRGMVAAQVTRQTAQILGIDTT